VRVRRHRPLRSLWRRLSWHGTTVSSVPPCHRIGHQSRSVSSARGGCRPESASGSREHQRGGARRARGPASISVMCTYDGGGTASDAANGSAPTTVPSGPGSSRKGAASRSATLFVLPDTDACALTWCLAVPRELLCPTGTRSSSSVGCGIPRE
jgi:hypothetical protein